MERSYEANGERNIILTNELQILIESLEKKCSILEALLSDTKKQEEEAKKDDFDFEQFDLLVDHKDDLLQCMEELDQGFDSLFLRIQDELIMKQSQYKAEIKRMQELIKSTIDYGAQISTIELRTKEMLTNAISRKRKELSKRKISSKSVMDYYKSTNQLNNLQPYFLDQKK